MPRLLLDTHALVWWATSDEKLSRKAHGAIEDGDSEVFVSAASAMEICTKVRIGKFDEARPLSSNFAGQVVEHDFLLLDITADHAELAGNLAIPHQDPFDRLLIAQARSEKLSLVSNEKRFDDWGVLRLW